MDPSLRGVLSREPSFFFSSSEVLTLSQPEALEELVQQTAGLQPRVSDLAGRMDMRICMSNKGDADAAVWRQLENHLAPSKPQLHSTINRGVFTVPMSGP